MDGFSDLPEDPRFASPNLRHENKAALEEIIQRAFSAKTVEQWLQELADGQVPAAKVNNFAEALSNPQILHREMVVEQEHPVSGKYKAAGNPIKMSDTEDETFAPAPTLGQHNREVLMGLLDYSENEVAALEKEGAI